MDPSRKRCLLPSGHPEHHRVRNFSRPGQFLEWHDETPTIGQVEDTFAIERCTAVHPQNPKVVCTREAGHTVEHHGADPTDPGSCIPWPVNPNVVYSCPVAQCVLQKGHEGLHCATAYDVKTEILPLPITLRDFVNSAAFRSTKLFTVRDLAGREIVACVDSYPPGEWPAAVLDLEIVRPSISTADAAMLTAAEPVERPLPATP